MNKILYRPNLKLPKHYETDGIVTRDFVEQPYVEENKKVEQLVEVANQILSLIEVTKVLPEELKPTINTMLNTLEFIFVQIDPDYIPGETGTDGSDTEEDPDISITVPDDEDKDKEIPEEDSLFYSSVVPSVVIRTIPKDKIKLINKLYCGTLLEITKDYINKLKKSTSDYFVEMGMLMKANDKKNITFLEKKYTYKTTDLKNKELYHVADFIVRSQIIRDQKQRLMNKIINEEESLNKIKACEVSRELALRYIKEQITENNTYHDLFRNMTLKETQLQYEQKIDNNLYELYKYLNSSVILLDECLRLYMREAQAKSILIKEEGIKL